MELEPWVLIQRNTFTRWVEEQLKTADDSRRVDNLENDLSDGLTLVNLVEVLSGKQFPMKYNRNPTSELQRSENIHLALAFLEESEGIHLVNIGSSDIISQNSKLILGLVWNLIRHYTISKHLDDSFDEPQNSTLTPRERLLNWIQAKIPDLPISNFSKDWNDGRAIGALVNGFIPDVCQDWKTWNPEDRIQNVTKAMESAEELLAVPQLIRPSDICNPEVDECSMMTYLSQFRSCGPDELKTIPQELTENRAKVIQPQLEVLGWHPIHHPAVVIGLLVAIFAVVVCIEPTVLTTFSIVGIVIIVTIVILTSMFFHD